MSFLADLDKVIKATEKSAFKKTFKELTDDKLSTFSKLPMDASYKQAAIQTEKAKKFYGVNPKDAFNLYSDKNSHLL